MSLEQAFGNAYVRWRRAKVAETDVSVCPCRRGTTVCERCRCVNVEHDVAYDELANARRALEAQHALGPCGQLV
jgi:hypothetical protein